MPRPIMLSSRLAPHAGHTMAWAAAHQEFESRLLGWFGSHPYTLQRHVAQDQPHALALP